MWSFFWRDCGWKWLKLQKGKTVETEEKVDGDRALENICIEALNEKEEPGKERGRQECPESKCAEAEGGPAPRREEWAVSVLTGGLGEWELKTCVIGDLEE